MYERIMQTGLSSTEGTTRVGYAYEVVTHHYPLSGSASPKPAFSILVGGSGVNLI